jgi:hypothetical protein
MEKLYKLKEDLIAELEEYAEHKEKSRQDVMDIKCLASAADHICGILEKAQKQGEQGGNTLGMYPRYWGEDGQYMDGNKMYGRNQSRASNGRYMDGQSGGNYSMYGHSENPVDGLRKLIRDAEDPNERRILEDALNRMQNR